MENGKPCAASPAPRRAPRLSAVASKAGIDCGPRQRQQHDGLAIEAMAREEGGGVRVRVTTQLPLDRYLQRGEIGAAQFAAGDRLRSDFERAGLRPRIVMHYAPRLPRTAGGGPAADHGLDARRRFEAAIDAVGRLGEGVLWHVCCVGETAGDWAHRHGRAPRDGIVLLRAALDELDRHYSEGPRRPAAMLSADRGASARRSPAAAAVAAGRSPVRASPAAG